MSVEFASVKLRRRGHSSITLSGAAALHADGTIELSGEAKSFAADIARVLDSADLKSPLRDLPVARSAAPSCAACPLVGKATPACSCIQIDRWQIAGTTSSASLMLRPGLPGAVVPEVEETTRARLRRELMAFASGRAAPHTRAA